MADTFGTYKIRSQSWSIRCNNGASLGAGLGKFAGAKSMMLRLVATKRSGSAKKRELGLRFEMSGFELNAEVGGDLIESTTGLSIAYSKPASDSSIPIYLNNKYSKDLMTTDFLGPCALISYSVGEAGVGKEGIKKYAGKSYLLLNMGSVVADRSADWLQKVVDNSGNSSTLGGAFKGFNKEGSPFNNAKAAICIDTDDFSASAKIKAAGVGLFSGTVTCTSCN